MKIIKSIEHLSLGHCNLGKLKKLEAVATAYHSYLQKVVDDYWENNRIPKKYVEDLNFKTSLSKRYQQTCGSQAIAIMKSYWSKVAQEVKILIRNEIKEGKISPDEKPLYYFANKYQLWFETEAVTIELKKKKVFLTIPANILCHLTELVLLAKEDLSKPEIKNLTLSLDQKVAQLQEGFGSFDYFLKLSTLSKGKPILIPIKLHKNAKRLLGEGELKKVVRLKKRNGRWFASFIIEKEVLDQAEKDTSKVGVDVGVKALLVDSNGNYYGAEDYQSLKTDIGKITEYTRRRQKLSVCIGKKQNDEDFRLPNKRYLKKQAQLRSRRQNSIGHAINQCTRKNCNKIFVLEDLSFNGKTKSRLLNRILNRSLLGYLTDKLRFRLIDRGQGFVEVQPAYSSQECHRCGWVSRKNRLTQEKFDCEICGHMDNADRNASLNLLRRSQDKELNCIIDHKGVKELLLRRFYDAHSVSSWLDLDSFLNLSGKEFREALNRQSATLKLKAV